eukprot:1580161-Pyramimonas_sp.AAC.1
MPLVFFTLSSRLRGSSRGSLHLTDTAPFPVEADCLWGGGGQRACEFLGLFRHENIRPGLLEQMPPLAEDAGEAAQ